MEALLQNYIHKPLMVAYSFRMFLFGSCLSLLSAESCYLFVLGSHIKDLLIFCVRALLGGGFGNWSLR